MAKFRLTLIVGHTPENNYDGYEPHRHVALFKLTPEEYLEKVVGRGLVFPTSSHKYAVLSPYQIKAIRDMKVVGYDFLEKVEAKHEGLYSLGNLHDGVDLAPDFRWFGKFVKRVEGSYLNANGKKPTADIYEYETDEVLELWQTEQGLSQINDLSRKGLLQNPENWRKSLNDTVPQWLFWTMINRLK